MKNRGRGVPVQKHWFSDPLPSLRERNHTTPGTAWLRRATFGKHFQRLARISTQVPAGKAPASLASSKARSGKEKLAMNVPASRLTEKMALTLAASLLVAAALFAPVAAAQASASSHDRWLHVRVTNPGKNEETVRVNVPLELAEKVLPTINKDRLHSGKVRLDDIDCHGVDLRALVDAVRTSKDGEFVTVQSKDSDVRVAKQNGYLFVHVFEKNRPKKSQVEVKVPMRVVDALLSGGKDELDLVAELHALSSQGDTELVSVKDQENTVRVWLDSKNVSD